MGLLSKRGACLALVVVVLGWAVLNAGDGVRGMVYAICANAS